MDRNDLLAATRAEFLRAYSEPLDHVIQRAEGHVFDKARDAPSLLEQSLFLDVRAVLLNQHIALKRQLIGVMEQLLNRSFQTAYSTFRPSFYDSLNSSALSLVDVSAFEDELQIDLMTKQLRDAAEDPLRDLNIRIALLFEQDDIKERENPFRPYLFARCIVMALEAIHVAPDLITPLAQQLSEEMAGEIATIYDGLNALLARNGIAAQLQLKIRKASEASSAGIDQNRGNAENEVLSGQPTPESNADPHLRSQHNTWTSTTRDVVPASRADQLLEWVQNGTLPPQHDALEGGATAQADLTQAVPHPSSAMSGMPASERGPVPQVSSGAKKGWLAEAQAVGAVLRNFFSAPSVPPRDHYPDDFNALGTDDFPMGMSVSSALADSIFVLQQSNTPSAAAMLSEDGRIRNLILEHRDELSEMSRDVNEQMIIDIVAMLFEFILRDTHVPAEVRAQLGRLQFLVLKIALHDPALFTQNSHPARMLVNRIGSIVQDLQQLDPGGERITAEICRIVEVLLSDITGDVSLFSQMLDDFDTFVARELRAADKQVDRAVQVVENAENRTLQFARATAMIADALSYLKVDDFLYDFLVNTWARVVERAGRTDPVQAKRFRMLVPDLVWSIAPKATEQDRKELFGLIPVLLNTLREGVALLAWSAREQQNLIDWLVDSHRHALRAANLSAPPPPRSYIDGHFEQFVNGVQAELQHSTSSDLQPALDGKLLDEAINEMEVQLNLLDQLFVLDTDKQDSTDAQIVPVEDGQEICLADVLERLRSGVAIEIILDVRPTRACLNWVSPTASNLVLSIENLPRPSVISVKVFRRLFAAQRVRFLEDAPLFERAVRSLLASADHLDRHVE